MLLYYVQGYAFAYSYLLCTLVVLTLSFSLVLCFKTIYKVTSLQLCMYITHFYMFLHLLSLSYNMQFQYFASTAGLLNSKYQPLNQILRMVLRSCWNQLQMWRQKPVYRYVHRWHLIQVCSCMYVPTYVRTYIQFLLVYIHM